MAAAFYPGLDSLPGFGRSILCEQSHSLALIDKVLQRRETVLIGEARELEPNQMSRALP